MASAQIGVIFLSLPFELPIQIYRYCLVIKEVIIPNPVSSFHGDAVSRQEPPQAPLL